MGLDRGVHEVSGTQRELALRTTVIAANRCVDRGGYQRLPAQVLTGDFIYSALPLRLDADGNRQHLQVDRSGAKRWILGGNDPMATPGPGAAFETDRLREADHREGPFRVETVWKREI